MAHSFSKFTLPYTCALKCMARKTRASILKARAGGMHLSVEKSAGKGGEVMQRNENRGIGGMQCRSHYMSQRWVSKMQEMQVHYKEGKMQRIHVTLASLSFVGRFFLFFFLLPYKLQKSQFLYIPFLYSALEVLIPSDSRTVSDKEKLTSSAKSNCSECSIRFAASLSSEHVIYHIKAFSLTNVKQTPVAVKAHVFLLEKTNGS